MLLFMFKIFTIGLTFWGFAFSAAAELKKIHTIRGDISPKSLVFDGKGKFFAQNMMYRHTVTVYDREFRLLETISDQVDLSDLGYEGYRGKVKGAPVESAFLSGGSFGYISNYKMYGNRFNRPGDDKCNPSQKTDASFLYKVDTQKLAIEKAIKVGSVPKFVAVSNDDRWVAVSNWCSFSVSMIDTRSDRVVKTIPVGAYPRGLVFSQKRNSLFVAVMGSYDIKEVSLLASEFGKVKQVFRIGRGPRHLVISPNESQLHVTLNGEGKVARIDIPEAGQKLSSKGVVKIKTGLKPRSMEQSADGRFLYVVNYRSHTVSKVNATTMKVVAEARTGLRPIGITVDKQTGHVWVACYSGTIEVFKDEGSTLAEG